MVMMNVPDCPGSDWVADGQKCYLVVETWSNATWSRDTPGMSWDEAIEVRQNVLQSKAKKGEG